MCVDAVAYEAYDDLVAERAAHFVAIVNRPCAVAVAFRNRTVAEAALDGVHRFVIGRVPDEIQLCLPPLHIVDASAGERQLLFELLCLLIVEESVVVGLVLVLWHELTEIPLHGVDDDIVAPLTAEVTLALDRVWVVAVASAALDGTVAETAGYGIGHSKDHPF